MAQEVEVVALQLERLAHLFHFFDEARRAHRESSSGWSP